jgi:hypothetical protein
MSTLQSDISNLESRIHALKDQLNSFDSISDCDRIQIETRLLELDTLLDLIRDGKPPEPNRQAALMSFGTMSHYYLYAACKTDGCKSHFLLMHFEAPDSSGFSIDYPDECLHFEIECSLCQSSHLYGPKDMRTKSSASPLHPRDWKPLLPFPPPSTRESN